MAGNTKQTLDRRAFLRRAATFGTCLLGVGIVGSVSSNLPPLLSSHAVSFPFATGGPPLRIRRTALEPIQKEGVITRLGILSDVHLCTYDNSASDKMAHALETLGRVAPGLDALFVLGDITLNGLDMELEAFSTQTSSVLQASFSTIPPMHLLMGNHDYWQGSESQFEAFFAAHPAATHFVAKQNTVTCLDGVTIIKLNGSGSYELDQMDFTGAYSFLADALVETASSRPDDVILVLAHEPPEHMSLPLSHECGYYGQGTSRDMVELIAQYPQARMLTGHIHNPLEEPSTVNWDLGFTSVHVSTVGSCLFLKGEMIDKNETGSQGLVLDIMEDKRVIFHRLDFNRQKYLGEPVLI